MHSTQPLPGYVNVRARQDGPKLHIKLPPVEGSTIPREASFNRNDYTCDGEFTAEVRGYLNNQKVH